MLIAKMIDARGTKYGIKGTLNVDSDGSLVAQAYVDEPRWVDAGPGFIAMVHQPWIIAIVNERAPFDNVLLGNNERFRARVKRDIAARAARARDKELLKRLRNKLKRPYGMSRRKVNALMDAINMLEKGLPSEAIMHEVREEARRYIAGRVQVGGGG